jgi:endoglucanase
MTPINANNIAYTLHFYAGTHGQRLRDKGNYAINQGLALFSTEWGTVNANGDGGVNYGSTEEWLNWMDQNKISWCNWSIHDKDEGASIFNPGGGLSESGKYSKDILHGATNYDPWRK